MTRPYSIERAFAKIKHWMRTARKRNMEDAWRHVGLIAGTVPHTNAPTTSGTQDMLPSIGERL